MTEIGRPNTTPPFLSVPNLTNSNQPSNNHAQYSVQPKTTQPQAELTNHVSSMAQQVATSKRNSCFTVPINHVLPNLSAWTFPTTGCAVPNVTISQWAPQGPSEVPNTSSDNNTTVPQLVPVTSGGTVYYLNPSSGPNLVQGAMPTNVSSTAPMSIGAPQVVPALSNATPRTEPTASTVQELAQPLAFSRQNHLLEWRLAQFN